MTSPQVLIAEDDGSLRNILAEMLTDRGVAVMQAADGVQASQMLEDNIGISLLLSDVKMPRMDGYALVEEALVRNSELKILMMTGYPGDLPPPAVLKAREIRTLAKPFDMDRMCDQVVDMLSRP
jgi:two-component system cell cycle sensor histidine kinase/response regulator CckA